MGSPWRLREGFATSSRALHEDVAGAEGFEKPPRRLREGFAKAPRAPPFGNDSSDNDKPPQIWCLLTRQSVPRNACPCCCALSGFPRQCPPRATSSRRAPIWSSEEAHLVNTILNQPNRRRVEGERLNREESWFVELLEDRSSPPPAGKILPHSYTKTRFRRERRRGLLHRERKDKC